MADENLPEMGSTRPRLVSNSKFPSGDETYPDSTRPPMPCCPGMTAPLMNLCPLRNPGPKVLLRSPSKPDLPEGSELMGLGSVDDAPRLGGTPTSSLSFWARLRAFIALTCQLSTYSGSQTGCPGVNVIKLFFFNIGGTK